MKKITFCLMMIMLSLNTFSNTLTAEKNATLASNNSKEVPVRLKSCLTD